MKAQRWPCVLSVCLLVAGGCTHPETRASQAVMPDSFIGLVSYVDAPEVETWMDQSLPFLILDVRTRDEFDQDGHAPGAVLFSYYLGSRRRPENADMLAAVARQYRPDDRILVLCSHGMRASQAAWELAEKHGFRNVHVFPGGYEGHFMAGYGSGAGWKSAGLPLDYQPFPQDGARDSR